MCPLNDFDNQQKFHLQHNTARLRLGWVSACHRMCAQLQMCPDSQISCVSKEKHYWNLAGHVYVKTWNGESTTFQWLAVESLLS